MDKTSGLDNADESEDEESAKNTIDPDKTHT